MKINWQKQAVTAIAWAIFAFILIFLPTTSAAVMPVYERLSPIANGLSAPTGIALDSAENIYITESIENRLRIFSQSGKLLKTLNGLSEPLGVAVDQSGRIYIGNKGTQNVSVYGADLTFLFKLGTGDGEFKQPTAIAISGDRVYVADSKEDRIKVYNIDGSFSFAFGATGSLNGQFNFPTSITINEASGEVLVLDRQHRASWMGEGQGARVQFFDMNGLFQRSFGEYGLGAGKLNKAVGVTVDREGRIYVTDTVQQLVQVFDENGVFLGAIYDADNQLRTPVGIAAGKSNRLFIASQNTETVEIYGLDQYEQMEVTPLTLSFAGKQSESVVNTKQVIIKNTGSAPLVWTADVSDDWITVSTASGSASAGTSSTLDVGIAIQSLEPGIHLGSIAIAGDSGAAEHVAIEINISSQPSLSVTPTALEFTELNGVPPIPVNMQITDTEGGSFEWSATTGKDWIELSKTSGTAPDTIMVSANASSLAPGTYTGDISITGTGVLASPASIPVTLHVIEAKGKIKVKTNLKEATFTLNGTETYTGNGKSWEVKDAPAGIYSIVFDDVAGYVTPASQSQTLENEGKITFSSEYKEKENNQEPDNGHGTGTYIIAGTGAGEKNPGQVKIFDKNGNESGVEFLAHSYTYGVKVAAGDINADGYDEIITAPGPGPFNPAEIHIFDRTGIEMSNLSFVAHDYFFGASVATADFNCDGMAEVITGAGAGAGNPAEVKVFVYDPDKGQFIDSGIHLNAHDTGYGVNVSAGDFDCDSEPEIITTPGLNDNTQAVIRIWKVDTSAGDGNWSVSLFQEFSNDNRYTYSVSIAAGDINGDSRDEVITGAGPHKKSKSKVTVFDQDGDEVSSFDAGMDEGTGVNVASSDLDGDGVSEVIAGEGPGAKEKAKIKVFDAYGAEKSEFTAMKFDGGVNVAVGRLGPEE